MIEHSGPKGLLIAAPSSGSGKTVLTLALLRALKRAGHSISGAKAGPDYIDPAFHTLAAGKPAFNLDPWAMGELQLAWLHSNCESDMLLVEGMMGLYDGAADGSGSAADLAGKLALPVLLVVDAAKQSHSVAALVRGFRDHGPELTIAGVLLNKVGSARHEAMLRHALADIGVAVFGAVYRNDALRLPERHLGLVQAGETGGIEAFIEAAAKLIEGQCDLASIAALFANSQPELPVDPRCGAPDVRKPLTPLKPLGQHIAIARDRAFSFLYPHFVSGWRAQGATVSFFSPLVNEAPDKSADAVFLPGGYPELHAGTLAAAHRFRAGMDEAADRGVLIYGECGGYMTLGEAIIDAEGMHHQMLGLLALVTSFETRKLHLGYRKLKAPGGLPFGEQFRGHEFHYTSAAKEEGEPLFNVHDALDEDMGPSGLRAGKVMGSYMHVISQTFSGDGVS